MNGPAPSVVVVSGEEASRLLAAGDFLERWQNTFRDCPWATVFQSPAYLGAWYRCYQSTHEPVLVYDQDFPSRGGSVIFLARERAGGQLVNAGAHQAEYHAWLSPPDRGDVFMASATVALEAHYPRYSLTFQYLPPDVPLAWARSGHVAPRVLLQEYERPLLDVADAEELDRYIRSKRRLRTKLNKLKRLGELRYERIRSRDALEAIMDDVIAFCDLRHGALRSVLPFAADPQKREFHLELLEQNVLMASALFLGDELIAAHLGGCGGGVAHLGILVHSPAYSGHSPGAHLIFESAQDLNRDSCAVFDLTPGGDEYKNRFATRFDQVQTLEIRPGEGHVRRQKAVTAARTRARRLIARLGVDPHKLQGRYRQLLNRNWRKAPRSGVRKARRWVYGNTEFRVYVMPAPEVVKTSEKRMARDRVGDLLGFVQGENDLTLTHFLSGALRRLEDGHHLYSYMENGRLLHFGWLVDRQKMSRFSEIDYEFAYPDNSAVLFDFYTDPGGRGRGLYQSALRQILADAAAIPGTEYMFISVLSDNGPSRHVIEKTGFQHYASVRESIRFGKKKTWIVYAGNG